MNISLKKIEENYNYSKGKYNLIHKSKYWEKSIKKKRGLYKHSNLKNFRSNLLAKNIDDFYISKKIFCLLNKWMHKKYNSKFLLKILDNENIGNSKFYKKYKKRIITPTDIFLIYYLKELLKKINLNNISTVCEIGQGYGMFASKLLKLKKFKMILIDLPESNFLTAFYLKKNFPDMKIILDIDLKNKKELNAEILKQGDIFILSPSISMGDIKIDLFINMRSMMEMNYDVIKKYFDLIHSKISVNGIFFSVNRYYKDLVGYPIEFHNYPYDNNWKILNSLNSKLQKEAHILISKRINYYSADIKNELKKIEKIYLEKVKLDQFILRRNLPPLIYKIYKKIKFFLTNEISDNNRY